MFKPNAFRQTGIALAMAGAMALSNLPVLAEQGKTPLQGSIIRTNQTGPTVNPDDLKEVEKGTPLEMTVATTLSTGGETEAGEEFFAKVTKDFAVDGKVVIPRGTLVHGTVMGTQGPGRMMRNGFVATKFDYMITPDGREIPIEADYTNRDNKAKAAAKIIGKTAGITLGGGVIGAMLVLKYGGIASVAASNGYALAGGAAVGGAVGLTAAMLKKGHNTMITPGTQLKVKLQDKLVLPTMNMPDEAASNLKLEGLAVKVLGMRVAKDPFGEPNEVTLTLDVNNKTENQFSFFDIALEDENGETHYASAFGDTGMWFQQLAPNAHISGNITFNVDNPTLQHYLVFYKQYSREPLAKIAITPEMKTDKKTANTRLKQLSKSTGKAPTGDFATQFDY